MKSNEEKLEEVFLRLDRQKTDEQEWFDYISIRLDKDFDRWYAFKKVKGIVDRK